MYFKQAVAAIVVYDVTNEQTFQTIKNWVLELKEEAGDDISKLLSIVMRLITHSLLIYLTCNSHSHSGEQE